MDSIKIYSKYLLEKTHKSHITEKFLKPNKNFHFNSSNLYYYFDGDNMTNEKLSDTVTANLKLYKQDLFEDLDQTDNLYEINDDGSYSINNEKEISSLSLEKLKKIYKKKYEEFERDSTEKPFMENLFTHYESSFRSLLEDQNKNIVKIYNESHKTDEKLDNLSYNEYKRSGTDYFDVTRKYYKTMIEHAGQLIEISLNLTKYNDTIKIENIVKDSIIDLKNVCEKKSKIMFNKMFSILQKNKSVINYEENYLKTVEDYLHYLNFAYYAKDFSDSNFNLLQKILKEQYKGNLNLITSLLNKYGYVNKQRALSLCDDIGNVNSTALSIQQKRRSNESLKDRVAFFMADVILKIRYKQVFKTDIETGDLQQLVKHLKEYDSYAVANYNYDSVIMLNLYALTQLINEKIYDDYLENVDFLKH